MTLTIHALTQHLKALGRPITLDMIAGTRQLIAEQLVQGSPDVVLQRDVQYGSDPRHRLDIFTSAERPDPDRPLIIFVHGGGFTMGDKYTPDTPFYDNIGHWAVRNGFNAINMTYRLAPNHPFPAGIEDIHSVMDWLSRNAANQGISSDKVFLMGQSAGASHVASYLAFPSVYKPDPHRVIGAALISGVFDFTTFSVDSGCEAYLGMDRETYAEKSPLQGLLQSEVPLLVAVAELDPGRFQAQSLALMQAYQERHEDLPHSVYMSGHNHLSSILSLGLEMDLLGPQLKLFIERHAAMTTED